MLGSCSPHSVHKIAWRSLRVLLQNVQKHLVQFGTVWAVYMGWEWVVVIGRKGWAVVPSKSRAFWALASFAAFLAWTVVPITLAKTVMVIWCEVFDMGFWGLDFAWCHPKKLYASVVTSFHHNWALLCLIFIRVPHTSLSLPSYNSMTRSRAFLGGRYRICECRVDAGLLCTTNLNV